MSTGLPKILYDNRLADATPVASSTDAGNYNVLNLRDWKPYTWWKPINLPATVTVDCGVTRSSDYLLVHGHNLFSTHCAVQLWGSTTSDFSSGVTAVASSNLLDSPDDFSSWTKYGGITVTPNAAIAPDGTLTASLINGFTTPGVDYLQFACGSILPNSNFAAAAVYIKRISTSGNIWIINSYNGNRGFWNINFALLSDNWERITRSHPAVTVGSEFQDSSGIAMGIGKNSGSGTQSAYFWRASLNAIPAALQAANVFNNSHSDVPFLSPFALQSYRYHRLFINRLSGSATPAIAIAAFGQALQIPRRLKEGFDPIGREPQAQSNRSEAGHPLGRVIDFELWSETLSWKNLNWNFVRNSFVPAWKAHLRGNPFAFAWDPVDHADEVYLLEMKKGFKAPHRVGEYCDLSFDVQGVVP